MTVTKVQALEIAKKNVKEKEGRFGGELALLCEATMEKEYGWVFFYTSKRYLESNDMHDAVVGNAPFIVLKVDGAIHTTGTARPVEYYLKEFELTLKKKG